MLKKEYKNIFENEDTHFYYVGCHNIIISQIKKFLPSKKGSLKILDAGCGTGILAKKLTVFGQVYGIDISKEALKFAKMRGVKIKKTSLTKTGFLNNSFDIIVSIDVLYHKWIDDDYLVVKELIRILKPGGILLLKLPAHEFLRGSHDLVVYTQKRYSLKDFNSLFKNYNVKLLKRTYIASFLFPFVLFNVIWEKTTNRIQARSSIRKVLPPINKLLIYVFHLENLLLNFMNIPFGISILAIAKKK